MIVVLFGQPCSGKTTLAKALHEEFDERQTHYHIDGDKLRELFSNKLKSIMFHLVIQDSLYSTQYFFL